MKNNKAFMLNSVTVALATAVIGGYANAAYMMGGTEIAKVGKGEVVLKHDTLTASIDKKGNLKLKNAVGSHLSELNRAGNPVRIIWYGNENDQDSKVAQTGAENDGYISGKVVAEGVRTYNKDQHAGEVSIEGQTNAIDSLGWSAPTNGNDVNYTLKEIVNNGNAVGEAELKGGQAAVHSKVNSFVSANGLSVVATADFGKDGFVDGISGASGGGGSASINKSDSSELDDDELDDMFTDNGDGEETEIDVPNTEETDMHGKNAVAVVERVVNNGLLEGRLTETGLRVARPPRDSYTPMFYGATASASGNGINLTSYVDTPDKYTFSDEKFSAVALSNLANQGTIKGSADIKGGRNVTHTYTKTIATANGVSVYASSGRFGQQSTSASIGDVNNRGTISGQLNQVSGNNSGFNSVHMYSPAESIASGNGISVYTETQRAAGTKTQKAAGINSVDNSGRITGNAYLKAGNGSGDLTINALAMGNGVSIYQNSNSAAGVALKNVDNKGIISGYVETHAGIVATSAKKGQEIPQSEARFYVLNKDTWKARTNPKPDLPAEAKTKDSSSWDKTQVGTDSYGTYQNFHAESTVTASGNGISAFAGQGSADIYDGAKLGDVNNQGVISGYNKLYHGYSRGYGSVTALATGVGIAVDSLMIRDEDRMVKYQPQWNVEAKYIKVPKNQFINSGIISGNYAALLAKGNPSDAYGDPQFVKTDSGYHGTGKNYGLMAGTMIAGNYKVGINISSSTEQSVRYYEVDDVLDNKGTYVYLKPSISFERTGGSNYYPTFKVTINNDYEHIDRIVRAENTTQTINGKKYEIINAELTASQKDSQQAFNGDVANKIINGVGLEKGAMIADGNLNLNHSIVNGYRTALYLEDNATVNVGNSVLNANGFKINRTLDPFAVRGSEGANTLTLRDNTIVNGNIDLGAGDDVINVQDSSVKMNGVKMDLGAGVDTVNFAVRSLGRSRSANDSIKVDYEIAGAENLVINKETIFTPNAKMLGVNNLTLNDNLIYQANSETEHALYQEGEQGSSLINVNGTAAFVVDMPNTLKKLDFGKANLAANSSVTFKSTNALLDVMAQDGDIVVVSPEDKQKIEEARKLAEQKAKEEAEEAQRQAELAKQEQARLEAEQVRIRQEEQAKIDAEKARDEARLALEKAQEETQRIAELVTQNEAKLAEEKARNEKLVQQREQEKQLAQKTLEQMTALSGTNAANGFLKNSASLTNKGQDLATTAGYNAALSASQQAIDDYLDQVRNQNIYGAVPMFALDSLQAYRANSLSEAAQLKAGEVSVSANALARKSNYKDVADDATSTGVATHLAYGVSDNVTLGANVASSKEKLNGNRGSYLKGNSVYSDLYMNIGNDKFTLINGVAYEKMNLKGKRYINNGYDSQTFDCKIDPRIYSVFTQAKYAIALGDNVIIEPKVGIAYNNVRINALNEQGDGGLEMQKQHFNTVDTFVGQDLTAQVKTLSGKFKAKLSLDYIHTSGQKDLSANFHNGETFTLRTEKNPNAFRTGVSVGYEWNNGVSVKAGVANTFHLSGSSVNALVGIGYQF